MRINVKTAGILGKYLPPGSHGNAAALDIASDATPLDVIKLLGLPLGDRYLIALNGAVVPSAERGERRLVENDDLAIMPPLKGG